MPNPYINLASGPPPRIPASVPYSFQLTGQGGTAPYRFAFESGTLPPGISMSATGLISGTLIGTASSFHDMQLRITDANNSFNRVLFRIDAGPENFILITPQSLPNGELGKFYDVPIGVSGGFPPYSITIRDGSLPPGLAVRSNGSIYGTPTQAGRYSFSYQVQDARYGGSMGYTIDILPGALRIDTGFLTEGQVGKPYSARVSAFGGTPPYTFSLSGSLSLPPGLQFSPTGDLTGTPTIGGRFNLAFRVSDSKGLTAFIDYELKVQTPLLANAGDYTLDAGLFVELPYTAYGGTPPYRAQIVSGSAPPGLTWNGMGFTGTPTQAGTYPLSIRFEDSSPIPNNVLKITQIVVRPFSASSIVWYTGNLPEGRLQNRYEVTLQAGGGRGDLRFSLKSGTLPPGLSLSQAGVISGTPLNLGAYPFVVEAADAESAKAQRSFEIRITSVILSLFPISPPMLEFGQSVTSQLFASGGTSPYTFYPAPGTFLPAGLTLSTSGLLSGKPSSPGAYTIGIEIRDAAGNVSLASSPFQVYSNAPYLTGVTSIQGAVGAVLNHVFSAESGHPPYRFALVGGLPPGIDFVANRLQGVPTQAGSFSLRLDVTDSVGAGDSKPLTLLIAPPINPSTAIRLGPSSFPDGRVGVPYTGYFRAEGGVPPYEFRVLRGPTPGLTMNRNGEISGTPTLAGTHRTDFEIRDSVGARSEWGAEHFIQVPLNQPPPEGPLVVTANVPEATVGQPYIARFEVSGGTPPYQLSIGWTTPLNGLLLGNDGVLSGTPVTAGVLPYALFVTDARRQGVIKEGQITIRAAASSTLPLSLLASSLPAARIGAPYSANFIATGGTAPYSFSALGPLPPGIALSAAGQMSGTPSAAGAFPISIQVRDAQSRSAMQNYELSIAPSTTPSIPPPLTTPLEIKVAALPPARLSSNYSFLFTATGGVLPLRFERSAGSFPAGLQLSNAGLLQGAPLESGSFRFTIRVADGQNATAQATFDLLVQTPPLILSATALPNGRTLEPYSFSSLSVSGGLPPYRFSLTGGTLPAGLSLGTDGRISGIPTQQGNYSFRLRVDDNATNSASQDFTIAITATPSLTILTQKASPATVNRPYSQPINTNRSTANLTFAPLSGSLPPGMELTAQGHLQGTPLLPGAYRLEVEAKQEPGQRATAAIELEVAPATRLSPQILGQVLDVQLPTAIGKAPRTFFLDQQPHLPNLAELRLTPEGKLQGLPASSGLFPILVSMRDADGLFYNLSYELPVTIPSQSSRHVHTLPQGAVGLPYNATIDQSLEQIRLVSGSLPEGLSLNSQGLITGTPRRVGVSYFTLSSRRSSGQESGFVTSIAVLASNDPATRPIIAGVRDAAGYGPGSLAPGTLLVIFGSGLGPAKLESAQAIAGFFPTALGPVRVLVDGKAIPLLYVRQDQIGALLPWQSAASGFHSLIVEVGGLSSAPFISASARHRLALFSADSSGSGNVAALNQDGSFHGPANAARAGDIVVLFGTGGGALETQLEDGAVSQSVALLRDLPRAWVGGVEAKLLYAGQAPGLVAGMLQFNLQLSSATPAGKQLLRFEQSGQSTAQELYVWIQ